MFGPNGYVQQQIDAPRAIPAGDSSTGGQPSDLPTNPPANLPGNPPGSPPGNPPAQPPSPRGRTFACFAKGIAIGAVGAVGGLAVGAATLGAPAAVVTGAIGVAGVIGGTAAGYRWLRGRLCGWIQNRKHHPIWSMFPEL
jgi:hypothetical protein